MEKKLCVLLLLLCGTLLSGCGGKTGVEEQTVSSEPDILTDSAQAGEIAEQETENVRMEAQVTEPEQEAMPAASKLASDPAMQAAGYALLTEGGEFGDVDFAHYYIYDMDGDGAEEIIVLAGTCEADAMLIVYTYADGAYSYTGYYGGGHSLVCGDSEHPGLLVQYGLQNVERVTRLYLASGELCTETVIAEHTVDGAYTQLANGIPLEPYSIRDYTPFGGASAPSAPEPSACIDVTLPEIGRSVEEILEYAKYNGVQCLSDWEGSFFIDGNPVDETSDYAASLYALKLDGSEINYYFPYEYITLTARDGRIVGYSQTGIQVSEIQNVYQLLQWLGEDYAALLDYEPEMFDGQNGYYLRWTTNNAVMVIFSAWFQDRSDWKNSMPWNFCMFERDAGD